MVQILPFRSSPRRTQVLPLWGRGTTRSVVEGASPPQPRLRNIPSVGFADSSPKGGAMGRESMKARWMTPLSAALAVAVLAVAPAAMAQAVSPVGAQDMTLGRPKARLTVIEYASASCPHCARFNNDVFPAFKAKYIDTGEVRYVFREFLTPPQSLAAAVFLTARCAGRDKYFSVVDAAFRAQQHIYETHDMRTPLVRIAKDAGVGEGQLMACLNDPAAQKALGGRVQGYMETDKIESTPTFVIDGERLEGEQTLAALDDAIAKARSSKTKP
jgi:protein-disulfide isomerase